MSGKVDGFMGTSDGYSPESVCASRCADRFAKMKGIATFVNLDSPADAAIIRAQNWQPQKSAYKAQPVPDGTGRDAGKVAIKATPETVGFRSMSVGA